MSSWNHTFGFSFVCFAFLLTPMPSQIPLAKQNSNWDSVWTQQISGGLWCSIDTVLLEFGRRGALLHGTEGPIDELREEAGFPALTLDSVLYLSFQPLLPVSSPTLIDNCHFRMQPSLNRRQRYEALPPPPSKTSWSSLACRTSAPTRKFHSKEADSMLFWAGKQHDNHQQI